MNFIPPPRTARIVKRSFCAAEESRYEWTGLFSDLFSKMPLDDFAVLTSDGPGCTPGNPMALVAGRKSVTNARSARVRLRMKCAWSLYPFSH